MKFLDSDRLLAEVTLEPLQGSRFQPTGFPSLGPAEFTRVTNDNQNVNCLLVESTQSMANRLEIVCWDMAKSTLVDVLNGMPLITVNNKDGNFLTNSLLEAHRMNSTYMLESYDKDKTLEKLLIDKLGITKENSSIDISKLAQFVLNYDPNSIFAWIVFK